MDAALVNVEITFELNVSVCWDYSDISTPKANNALKYPRPHTKNHRIEKYYGEKALKVQ